MTTRTTIGQLVAHLFAKYVAAARAIVLRLRRVAELTGYHLHALDGEMGHVEDFIIDDERTWAIRYLIADTKNWWPGKHVLISPQWIERASWLEQQVFVDLSLEAIKASPEFTADSLLTRGYEPGLDGHYKRMGCWTDTLGTAA